MHLTPIEFRRLSLLVRRRGWVVRYDQILRDVWGPAYVGERANLKLYIWYLRRKIERDPSNPELVLDVPRRRLHLRLAFSGAGGLGASDCRCVPNRTSE